MLSFLALTALVIDPDVDVSYCARLYAEGNKPTYYHLYVCRHDGAHRRQLTFGAKSTVGSMWLDRNRIGFLELDGDAPLSLSYGANTWTGHIVVLNLKSGERRVLRTIKTLDPWPSVDQDSRTITLDGNRFHIDPTHVTKDPHRGDPFDDKEFGHPIDDGTNIYEAHLKADRKRAAYTLRWPRGSMDDDDKPIPFDLKVTQGGRSRSFSLKGDGLSWAKAVRPSTIYVVSENWFRKFTDDEYLYRLDFKTGKSTVLVPDEGNLLPDLNRGVWLGSDTDPRPLGHLKDGREVWVHSLFSGDWKTGKRWTLATGLVYVWDRHFRPAKATRGSD